MLRERLWLAALLTTAMLALAFSVWVGVTVAGLLNPFAGGLTTVAMAMVFSLVAIYAYDPGPDAGR